METDRYNGRKHFAVGRELVLTSQRFLSTQHEGIQEHYNEKLPDFIGKSAVLGGRALGHVLPLSHLFRWIAAESWIDIDNQSHERLVTLGASRKPVLVAANHRAVDPELYPRSHYQFAMSVDSFILQYLFEGYQIPLHFLAQYNRGASHHRSELRRFKAKVGNYVREGLYEELGYIPANRRKKRDSLGDYEKPIPYATKPVTVAQKIQEHVRNSHSVGFFTYFQETDDEVPLKLFPGAVYFGSRLDVNVLPVFIKNARHMDPRRTLPPDNVVLRVGEPMEIPPLAPDKAARRRQLTEHTHELRRRMVHLHNDAFAAQPG